MSLKSPNNIDEVKLRYLHNNLLYTLKNKSKYLFTWRGTKERKNQPW